jgi:hypothetical protein
MDIGSFLERPVELVFSDLAPQRGLRELDQDECIVADALRRALRVFHLEIQNAVHRYLHILAHDADLFRDVIGGYL